MAIHTSPTGEDHDTSAETGRMCSCMPRVLEGGELIVHNSFDKREFGEVFRKLVQDYKAAVARGQRAYTAEQRDLFEHAERLLDLHYPECPS